MKAAVVGENLAPESWVAAVELADELADGAGLELHVRVPARELPEHGRDAYRHRHISSLVNVAKSNASQPRKLCLIPAQAIATGSSSMSPSVAVQFSLTIR